MRIVTTNSISYLSKAAAAVLLGAAIFLTGCGIGNVSAPANVTPIPALTITGTAFGGATPILNGTVTLYTTGATGYGKGATSVGTASTGTTGSFTISPTYSAGTGCSSTTGPWLYATVASGGPTTGDTNSAILLVAALGRCDTVSSAISAGGYHVKINEATTAAAAYSLNAFSVASTDAVPVLNIGTSATNIQGLADGFANAALLANTQTSNINTSTATVLLPTAALGSLGNIISACVNTDAGTSVGCTAVLGAATTPTAGATTPTNVYQALQNMASYPGNNVTKLLSYSPSNAPFYPSFAVAVTNSTTAPNDLSLGIAYLNSTLATSGGNSPVGITIDGSDNVWVLGGSSATSSSGYNYISELTSASGGASYTNPLGTTATLNGTHTLRNARFDTAGNMWITDKNSSAGGVIELPKSGSSVSISGATEYTFGIAALDQNDYDLAVDATGNIFTASYGAQGNCTASTSGTECYYVEFPVGSSTPYTATDMFGTPSATESTPTVRGMAADTVSSSSGLGNIWTANYGILSTATAGTSVEILTPSTGSLATVTVGSAADSPFGVALDKVGGGYVTTTATQATSALYYVPQGTTTPVTSTVAVTGNSSSALANIPNAASSTPASSATTPLAIGGLNGPGYDAVDGAGNVYLTNYNYGTIAQYSPSLSAYTSPFYGFSPSLTIPAATLTVTAVTLVSPTATSAPGTANIYYTGDTVVNGQQVTFSGFPSGGNYAFLNGNTYTVSGTSFNYFVIPDGGQAAQGKTTVSGTAAIAASNQVLFQCGPYVTNTTTTTCTTVGNGTSRNNAIGIDRAGTVWTLGTNGTLVGMIGTAAPTNPVLAAGQSGILP